MKIFTLSLIVIFTITLSLNLTTAYAEYPRGISAEIPNDLKLETVKQVMRDYSEGKIFIQSNTKWTGTISGSDLGSSTKEGNGNAVFDIKCTTGGIVEGNIQKETEHGYLIVTIIRYQDIMTQEHTDAPYGTANAKGICYYHENYPEEERTWTRQYKDFISKFEGYYHINRITNPERNELQVKSSCEDGIWTGTITSSKKTTTRVIEITTHKNEIISLKPEGKAEMDRNGTITLNQSQNTGFIKVFKPLHITQIISTQCQTTNDLIEIPQWVRNLAELWVFEQISDKEFANAIEFLIKQGIITV